MMLKKPQGKVTAADPSLCRPKDSGHQGLILCPNMQKFRSIVEYKQCTNKPLHKTPHKYEFKRQSSKHCRQPPSENHQPGFPTEMDPLGLSQRREKTPQIDMRFCTMRSIECDQSIHFDRNKASEHLLEQSSAGLKLTMMKYQQLPKSEL